MKKNPVLQDSPPAADRFSDRFPLRRSAIPPGELFVIQEIRRNFLYHKKTPCMDISPIEGVGFVLCLYVQATARSVRTSSKAGSNPL